MTERLSALLNREVDTLDVPPPPAAAVLSRGRGLRRRRRVAGGTAIAATLAVVATSAVLVVGGGDDTRRVDPAPPAPVAADLGEVFSVGTEVYLDGGERSVTIDDASVKSVFYTSAGLVVRHGDNPWSDGGGPQRFSLVTPDGEVRPMALVTEEVYHASDPSQPYLVYADGLDREGAVTAHVLDVRTEEEVLTVPLPEHSGRFAPIALSGETLYVSDYDRDRTFEIDVSTGDVTRVDDTASGQVAGGRATKEDRRGVSVVDVATGDVLLAVPAPPGGYASITLSPDGRYAKVVTEDGQSFDPVAPVVHDIDAGTSVELPASDDFYGEGWSYDSETLFRLDRAGTLTSCAAATGVCVDTVPDLAVTPDQFSRPGESPGDDPRDDLVLGGIIIES